MDDEVIRIDARIDTEQAKADLDELRDKIRSFSNSAKKYAENATKALKAVSEAKVEGNIEDAGKAMENMAEKAEETAEAVEKVSEAVEEISKPAEEAVEAMEDMAESAEEISESMDEVVDDAGKMETALDDATETGTEGMTDLATSTEVVDDGMTKVSTTAKLLDKTLKGLSIYAILRFAAKGIKEVYTTTEEAYASIRKASTMFGDVAVDQENLVNKLSKIAADTGSDISVLGEAVYQAMSAGIAPTEDMADVLSAVEKSAKLASGGFTDTETAMSATLSVLNAYKMDIKDLDKIQGILLQTQNKGVTTVGQLGSALSKVTPTASAFGVSFEQVASAIALMTKQGTSTEIATTALSTVLSELGKSGTTASENLEKASKASGKASTSFKGLLDEGMNVSEILSMMGRYAEENGLSLVDMFGSIEAGRAALQLAGENTSDFNDILASMSDTAGLVGEAFEKTVTPADKLSSAFNNLVVSIGTKLKPTWDGLLGSMADMLTKLTNQGTAGDKLNTSFESLKTALDEYKSAEEQARIETNALNNSILSMAKTNLNRALNEASLSYSKNASSIEEYRDELEKTDRAMEKAQKSLDTYASKTEYTTTELQQMSDEERNLAFQFESGEYFLKNFNAQNQLLLSNAEKRIALSAKLSEAEQAETDMIETLAMLYAEDAESAEFLLTAYPKLTDKVRERSKAYVEQKNAIGALVDEGQQLTGNSPTTVVTNDNKALKESIEGVIGKYDSLKKASDVLGDSFYTQKDYLEEMKALYARGLVEGLDSSSEAMKKLEEEIKKVKENIEDVDDATIDWEGTLKDFRNSALTAGLKSVSAAFDEIFQKEENLKKLEEELSDLSSEEKDNIDAVAEAQEELDDAKARDNEKDIKNAEKSLEKAKAKLQATRDTITAVNAEKKAVEDGSSVWKAFGNSAMQSLGAILQALGSELAAKAAISLFESPWLAAGLGAASVAAFGAAEWIKSQKFAQGGIVGGSSYSGDNVLARVNSGELILNMAQQDNVAKALSALADMSGIGGVGGAGVNVYLSGASFYGLDEPAVGKAIYDNIRQLQYEGVI